jgi:hypothetical protein
MKGKKTGGRVKGTPNARNAPIKEGIAAMLAEYHRSGKMEMDFAAIDPKDRLQIAEKLMQYTMAKIQSVALDLDSGVSKITIEQELINLSKE